MAEAKSKTGKIKVTYTSVYGYDGNGHIRIKNKRTGKTIVDEKINFGKLQAKQGEDCCVKTYEYKIGNNRNGDKLKTRVDGNGTYWINYLDILHTGKTTKITIDVADIECFDFGCPDG